MKRLCPTIQELLAFDAVVRHVSMKSAAEELCLSTSGISKQVAGLEKFLGVALFVKNGRGVQITPQGSEYWEKISPALRMIESATVEVSPKAQDDNSLVLSCVPTFLSKWLIPRLPEFKQLCPDATFFFRRHITSNDPFPSDIDAAICDGLGTWTDVTCEYLLGRQYVCIYSPKLLAKGRKIASPAELTSHTLLHLDHGAMSWRQWGLQHHLDEEKTRAGPHFVQYSAVIQAALNGLGIGLVPTIWVEQLLRDGTLVAFNDSSFEEHGHFLWLCSHRLLINQG